MKKPVIILGITALIAVNCFGQANDKEIFKELFLYYKNGYSQKDIKIGSDFKDFDGINFLSACYVDDKGQIRRFVNYETYPEGVSYFSCVYDHEGKLQRISTGYNGLEDNEYGTAFKQYDTDSRETIKYEFLKEGYDDVGELLAKNHSGKCDDFQLFFRLMERDLSGYLTSAQAAKELAKDKYLEGLRKSSAKNQENNIMVVFDKPKVGDYTFITANHVNIRENPDKKANVITKAHTGYFVEIKNVITDGNDELWYEIKFLEGYASGYNKRKLYIYGDYIDDTAQTVKK
jgi:hypothetical protein